MASDIDRTTVPNIIDLDDAAKAAEARRVGPCGGPVTWVLSPDDDDDMVPTGLTPEEQLLHDRLGALDDHTLARVLAMYWLGRHASFAAPADEETYRGLLAHAEDNLDHTPWYLKMKPDLGKALRTAMANLGA